MRVRFGVLQALALADRRRQARRLDRRPLADKLSSASWVADLDRALDFISFPLLIYGLVTLIASRAEADVGADGAGSVADGRAVAQRRRCTTWRCAAIAPRASC